MLRPNEGAGFAWQFLIVISLGAALLNACNVQTQQRRLSKPAEAKSLDGRSPFLKAHMLNGRVYILSPWQFDSKTQTVSGPGELLGLNREVIQKATFSLALDSVALFETNVVKTSGSVAALSIITGASVALTIYCAANPKACFGSCPTFYVSDGERELLQAEGFSASVTRALEARDIDALYRARPTSRDFKVRMTNEALETHIVRYADLLLAPRPSGGRVFATSGGAFWRAGKIFEPSRAIAPEGDCLATLRVFDGAERFSTTDSTDLAAREIIELEFPAIPEGNYGLVIASRQSLLSTYLFYQALAYMGRSAGNFLAALERQDAATRERSRGINRVLGGIEVNVQNANGDWVAAGQTSETGPLATDTRIVTLPPLPAGATKIQLRLARGHWRLDYLALAQLGEQVTPIRLRPEIVYRGDVVDENARQLLLDSARVLTTFPGDEYTFVYRLPKEFSRYELFLESRGYYLEWMREEWMKEENPAAAAMMFLDPQGALRMLAPAFKKIEAGMEQKFWSSRYAH
jgi:hypothetical protein